MKLGDYIEMKNLSQADFGRIVGVSQAAIDRYVRGARRPRYDIIPKIVNATNGKVTANDFYDIPPRGSG